MELSDSEIPLASVNLTYIWSDVGYQMHKAVYYQQVIEVIVTQIWFIATGDAVYCVGEAFTKGADDAL